MIIDNHYYTKLLYEHLYTSLNNKSSLFYQMIEPLKIVIIHLYAKMSLSTFSANGKHGMWLATCKMLVGAAAPNPADPGQVGPKMAA